MNNTLSKLLVLGALAGMAACGDDSDGGNTDGQKDAGQLVPLDAGSIDSGTPTTDSSTPVTPGSDSGTPPVMTGDCFTGTPSKMTDFLNRCTTSDVQSPMKTLSPTVQALLNADGTVKPL